MRSAMIKDNETKSPVNVAEFMLMKSWLLISSLLSVASSCSWTSVSSLGRLGSSFKYNRMFLPDCSKAFLTSSTCVVCSNTMSLTFLSSPSVILNELTCYFLKLNSLASFLNYSIADCISLVDSDTALRVGMVLMISLSYSIDETVSWLGLVKWVPWGSDEHQWAGEFGGVLGLDHYW